MNFLKDEGGQGAAEYILLFGGVIVVAIGVLIIYNNYLHSEQQINVANDAQQVREHTVNKTEYGH